MTGTATGGHGSPEPEPLLTSSSTSPSNETSDTKTVGSSSAPSTPSSSESSPADQNKRTNLFGRIFCRKGKGLKNLLAQDVETQRRAGEEKKERAIKWKRVGDDRMGVAKFGTSENEAQEDQDTNNPPKAGEKNTKHQYLSGILYGFDPNAGKLQVNHGHQVSHEDEAGADELSPQPSETSESKRRRGETWGVDHNKPGMRDRFRGHRHGGDDVENGTSF
ncbi:hypothetical protein PV08_10401 [Exophiala spinifera]|uniref:Uncharacterized protein n=1 Tax=Exophiala spinifera TaxID=91928 RepID=A0A0D1Y825_9EURO|nr:uncharacterized protein PV08_10401 [Exophiala spinifera]KIW11101.1 hypothetical protein PV08_10401 [Exophiala spinifera]